MAISVGLAESTEEDSARVAAEYVETHSKAIAAADSPEAAIAEMQTKLDTSLSDGNITQAYHDKLQEIYTEAGADSQKFSQLMVESDAFLRQESAKISEDQANNHNVLATMLADKGIDIGSFGSFGAIFAMIFVMIDPEMSKEFMAKMKETAGLDADTEVVVTPVVADAEDTQPAATVEETISNIAENAQAAALLQHQEQEAVRIAAAEAAAENTSGTDLGGVDGTAVTYVTPDKPDDVAVEGSSVIQIAMNNGDSVVSGSFNNNVTAEGSQVNATVDQDAAISVIPAIPDPAMTDTLVVHGM
ncbi:MAG: hypothetical protein COB36_06520 [Alphaproteobacteria bacterium]|nr:MAG: hypothetical protein COB36_06520 [Alphaproteobacteria bacterium]